MDEITDGALRMLKGPNQIFFEWKGYLQFCQLYCKYFAITKPVVVELGTQNGHQKAHYKKFLDAAHIGIDISSEYSRPDILGDTHAQETKDELNKRLAGRPVNILFIDAFHAYEDAKKDYEDYGQMAQDIVALHDIRHEKGIEQLWEEIKEAERGNPKSHLISIGHWKHGWCELGIGILVKKSQSELRPVLEAYGALPQA